MDSWITYNSGVPALELGQVMDLALQFFFAMLRVGAFIIAAPVFGARFIPVQVRVIMSAMIALPIMGYADLPDVQILTSARGVAMIFGEIALGVSAGLLLTIFFSAAVVAGDRIATTAGLGFAAQIDPMSGSSAPVVSQVLSLALMVLFVSVDGHLMALRIILDSYVFIPPGSMFDVELLMQAGIAAGGEMFAHGAKLMMPVVVVLLLVNMGIGVITRSAPQLNIFSFGFPLTLSVTMILLYLGAPIMGSAMDKLLNAALDALMQMMTGVANG